MTKYYVGYAQENEEYVYVSNIDIKAVKISQSIEQAINFDEIDTARELLHIAKIIDDSNSYKILEVVNTIKEVR